MGRISPRNAAAALGAVLSCVAAAAAFGALSGYVGTLQARHAPERQRIRELQESIGKGVGGDLARAKVAELQRKIDADSDPAPAIEAAKARAATLAAIAFVATLPFLIGWLYRERLTSVEAG